MKRLVPIVILSCLGIHTHAQVSDMYLGDGAEPSITFNRSADFPRVVVSYMSWSAGAYSGLAYRVSRDGGLSFLPAGQRDNAGFYDARDRKMAAHSISGDPNSSNVYTFYVKTKNFKAPPGDQFGGLDNRYQALYVKRSTDNGATWKPEKQIYTLPISSWPTRWATVPPDPTGDSRGFYRMGRVWSCVTPNGTVHVVWYDNREGYADSRLDPQLELRELDKWTLHRAVSFDNGVTWSVRSNIFTKPSIGGAAIPDALYLSYWMPPGETLGLDASNDKLYIVAPDSSTYLTDEPDKPQIMYEMIDRFFW